MLIFISNSPISPNTITSGKELITNPTRPILGERNITGITTRNTSVMMYIELISVWLIWSSMFAQRTAVPVISTLMSRGRVRAAMSCTSSLNRSELLRAHVRRQRHDLEDALIAHRKSFTSSLPRQLGQQQELGELLL